MPKFSAFTPFGQLTFSSKKSHGQLFYEEQVKAVGGDKNYTDDFASLAMARVYANAMALGRCRYAIERVTTQILPAKALELLPRLEKEYGLIPEPGATLAERRAELAVAAIIARGARRSNVESILTQLFGDDFTQYITVDADDAVASSATPADVGVYDKPGAPRSVFMLAAPIARIGVAVTVQATLIAGLAQAPEKNQRFIIDPGEYGRVEAVTVTAASLAGSTLTLTATFTKPHAAGTLLATGRHPNLTTSKRLNSFVVSSATLRDNRSRRRLNRAARRLVRAVSTWAILDSTDHFKVDEGELLYTSI